MVVTSPVFWILCGVMLSFKYMVISFLIALILQNNKQIKKKNIFKKEEKPQRNKTGTRK